MKFHKFFSTKRRVMVGHLGGRNRRRCRRKAALSPSPVVSISGRAFLAQKSFRRDLRRLKVFHSQAKASITRIDNDVYFLRSDISSKESYFVESGEKFIFMQKLRDFVDATCDLFQHKDSQIVELERQIAELLSKRAKAKLKRRNDADELKKLEVAVEAAMSNDSSGQMIEAAKSAAQVVSTAATPVQLIHWESDSLLYHLTKGEAGTDESESENTPYESERINLIQNGKQMFADAAEEYADISALIKWLQQWKEKYPSCYRDANVSSRAVDLLSTYVRLDLLEWNPLHDDTGFDNMKWYSQLLHSGLLEPAGESSTSVEDKACSNDADKDGTNVADANLMTELVEKFPLMMLKCHLKFLWDVLSTRQTQYALSATNLVMKNVPRSSCALRKLLIVVSDRLSDAVANFTIPAWDANILEVVPNAAEAVAYRFGMSVRLMRNICLWKNIVEQDVLEKIALDDLLGSKVLPHLRSIQSSSLQDAIKRSEMVLASLDEVWVAPSVTEDRSPKLQPLVDYILTVAQALQDKHVNCGFETETTELARRLMKMLVDLKEYDHARTISSTFNIEEEK